MKIILVNGGKIRHNKGMKRFALLLIVFMLFSAWGCQPSDNAQSGVMDIRAFSIGQADSILLTYDDTVLLIDTGENDDGEDIAKSLIALGINSIDLLIITHFDKDHIGGFDELTALISVERVLLPDYERDSKHYTRMMDAIETLSIPCERISSNQVITLGDANLEIWPSTVEYAGGDNDDNEQSLITAVNYGFCRMLFMGDANEDWLNSLCYGTYNLTCDLVKMPWHGKWDSTITAFIAFSLPQHAIITDSTKNPADDTTIDALETIGAEIYRTMNGDVHLRCDGETIFVP